MSRSVLLAAVVGISIVASGANRAPDRGDEDNYWKKQSLILARVVRSGLSDEVSEFALRPLGTLSGNFDVSRSAEIIVRVWLKDFGFEISPRTGELLLAVVVNTRGAQIADARPRTVGVARFIGVKGAIYMPLAGASIAVVNGLSDPKFRDTLSSVQRLRLTPNIQAGKGAEYWREHSLIFGEVQYYLPREAGRMPVARILLRPFATLSGSFDAGSFPIFSVEWNSAMRDEIVERQPRGGDKVLVVVQRNARSPLEWDSPDGRSAYMPGNHESFHIVKGLGDPEVEATLKAVQVLRKADDR